MNAKKTDKVGNEARDLEREAPQPEANAAAHDERAAAGDPRKAPAENGVEQQLEALQTQLEDYINRLKHNQADFENYKKRKEREQVEFFVLLEDRLLKEILPLYDDFKRAFEAFEANGDQAALVEGTKRIFTKFKDYLHSKDVACLDAVGEKFDPSLHEVLLAVESEGEPHRVLEQFEGGYTRQGRLLRPSRVTVSKPPPATEDDAAPEPTEAKHAEQPDQLKKE